MSGGRRGAGTGRRRPLREGTILFAAVLQGVALGGLAVESLYGIAFAMGAIGRTTSAWSLVFPVVILGLLAVGVVGFRRWVLGGSPSMLYAVDAVPVIFMTATAGPGAFQTPGGLMIAAVFIAPMVALYLADRR